MAETRSVGPFNVDLSGTEAHQRPAYRRLGLLNGLLIGLALGAGAWGMEMFRVTQLPVTSYMPSLWLGMAAVVLLCGFVGWLTARIGLTIVSVVLWTLTAVASMLIMGYLPYYGRSFAVWLENPRFWGRVVYPYVGDGSPTGLILGGLLIILVLAILALSAIWITGALNAPQGSRTGDVTTKKHFASLMGFVQAEKLESPDDSIATWHQILGWDPNDSDALVQLDALYSQQGDWFNLQNTLRKVDNLFNHDFISMVWNFVDILAHSRSQNEILREMVPDDHIYCSGNTSIDALLWATKQPVTWTYPELGDLVASGRPIIVATLHRRENWPHLADMATALDRITSARPVVCAASQSMCAVDAPVGIFTSSMPLPASSASACTQ